MHRFVVKFLGNFFGNFLGNSWGSYVLCLTTLLVTPVFAQTSTTLSQKPAQQKAAQSTPEATPGVPHDVSTETTNVATEGKVNEEVPKTITPKVPTGPKVFVLEPHLVGIADAVKKTISAAIAQAAQDEGMAVLTRDDASDLISQSADLAMLGSESDGASLAELGKLVGAPHLLTATVSNIDGDTILHLRLVDSKKSAVVARREVRASDFGGGLVAAVGAATRLVLAPIFAHLKGTVTLKVSEENANVSVDDRLIGITPIAPFTVPGGTHLILVTKEGFIRDAQTVRIKKGTKVSIDVELRPSVEFAQAYHDHNGLYRTLAWVSTGVTIPLAVAAGGGAAAFVWANNRSKAVSATEQLTGDARRISETDPRFAAANKRITDARNLAGKIGFIGPAFGALAVTGGLVASYFWIFGDSPGRYDAFLTQADQE